MVIKRNGLSKKARFEVFKRDSFKCQYCGEQAPEVILHVDHIIPVSKGGDNHISNLITSCQPCNSGKKDRLLNDNSIIFKHKEQLDEINEKRIQLEMLSEWRNELLEYKNKKLDILDDYWRKLTTIGSYGYEINDFGRKTLIKLLKRFNVDEIMSAMDAASDYYLKLVKNEDVIFYSGESTEIAFNKIGGICHNRRTDKEIPYRKHIYHLRKMMKQKFRINEGYTYKLLLDAFDYGVSFRTLKAIVIESSSYKEWRRRIDFFTSVLPPGFLPFHHIPTTISFRISIDGNWLIWINKNYIRIYTVCPEGSQVKKIDDSFLFTDSEVTRTSLGDNDCSFTIRRKSGFTMYMHEDICNKNKEYKNKFDVKNVSSCLNFDQFFKHV